VLARNQAKVAIKVHN